MPELPWAGQRVEVAGEPGDVVTLRSTDGLGHEEAFCAFCRATWRADHWCTPMLRRDLDRLEAKLDAQETLQRGLIVALKAGAIGRWQA